MQFTREHDNLQDGNLQVNMAKFSRYRYGSLQNDSLHDVDMNAVSKNMIHSLNLNGMWRYVIIRVENA